MYKVKLRKNLRQKRNLRVRKKILGTTVRPRLTIFRSNKYVYAQVIDDSQGKTLVSASLTEIKKLHEKKAKVASAFELGEYLAKEAVKQNILKVVFDRKGYRYHGRVKSLADGARKGGLEL